MMPPKQARKHRMHQCQERFSTRPIEISNMAVHFIESGDYVEASTLLSRALRLLLRPVTSSSAERPPLMQYAWSKNAPISCGPAGESSAGRYVFLRGMFVVKGNEDPRREHDALTVGEAKAVILYNAALSAHLLALRLSESSLLRKAQYLYRLAWSILQKQQRGSKPMPCLAAHTFFHLAVLNNLGRLSYELANFRLSGSCFQRLQQNLSVFFKSTTGNQKLYSDKDLQGMLSNAILGVPIAAPCA